MVLQAADFEQAAAASEAADFEVLELEVAVASVVAEALESPELLVL